MSQNELVQQLQKLIGNGQIIQAIRLLRSASNLDLSEAKEMVERIRAQIAPVQQERADLREQGIEPTRYVSDEAKYAVSYQHTSHAHKVEKDLPTEVYLLFQQGETKVGIRRLSELKSMTANQAAAIAKQFYQQNPQYQMEAEKKESQFAKYVPFLFFAFIAYKILTG